MDHSTRAISPLVLYLVTYGPSKVSAFHAQAFVHCYVYALTSFICEVSCKLTCLLHLYVCMHEGAVGCSQSIVQFSPYEWIPSIRLTL